MSCSKAIVVKLAPHEYRNLVELAALQGKSLSDTVRGHLGLPSESEAQPSQPTADRHLRLIGDRR